MKSHSGFNKGWSYKCETAVTEMVLSLDKGENGLDTSALVVPWCRWATVWVVGQILAVLRLQFAAHVEQQILVVDDLQLSDVGLGLEVRGRRLCVHGQL